VNKTARLYRLVPTLLVFRVYPRIVDFDPLSPNITEQAGVIKKAIVEVRACYTKQKVTNAL